MSQLTKVEKALRRNTAGPGITVAQIARVSGLPKDIVYKRVSDLRNVEGKTIYSNFRTVNGKRKMYYRIAS